MITRVKWASPFSKSSNKTSSFISGIGKEKVTPKLLKELCYQEPNFQADHDDQRDLKQLLNLSNVNGRNSKFNSWEKILPIYPISPIN